MKVMVVEDDAVIRQEIGEALANWGYETVLVTKFDAIVSVFSEKNPQLVILDLVLPTQNGYFWCQEIRKISSVPIVFLSSQSENMNIVMAMQFGADDYITKPFDMNVLVAKIQALLRRSYEFGAAVSADTLSYGELLLNLDKMTLSFHGESLPLTKTEFALLHLLFGAQGDVVTREELMESCWQSDDFIDDNTLAVNINRLRKKGKSLGNPHFIKTIRGVGYALVKEGQTDGEV